MKVLIMGLSGSGKTFLSKLLQKELSCAWYNADNLREMANDCDFSKEGRRRQSFRMKALADFEKENGRRVICDFICPTKEVRKIFDADYCIWMDTIKKSNYENTDKIFEKQENFNLKISKWKPKKIGVFAGKVDYPNYNFFDKYIIKLIMLITSGPIDISQSYEFTDWSKVEDFAKELN